MMFVFFICWSNNVRQCSFEWKRPLVECRSKLRCSHLDSVESSYLWACVFVLISKCIVIYRSQLKHSECTFIANSFNKLISFDSKFVLLPVFSCIDMCIIDIFVLCKKQKQSSAPFVHVLLKKDCMFMPHTKKNLNKRK